MSLEPVPNWATRSTPATIGRRSLVTYSPKVFIPLTRLCRDVCSYCTFAHPPRKGERCFMHLEEVRAVARAGALAGCKEALFTLGDRPEKRYRLAREELKSLGCETTVDYLDKACRVVLEETGLLPHINAGVLTYDEMARLRAVSASQGLMLESLSMRLCAKGGPHYGSPDKNPEVRLRCLEDAGRLAIPFTTGILIGIGETRHERLEALVAINESHRRYGHVQEVIIQNFRAKPGTRMADAPEPDAEDLLWTVAEARRILDDDVAIQVPPNLNPDVLVELIGQGVTDWGGVSPVTPDHVNPEAPWPERERLREVTGKAGHVLLERLTLHPRYARDPERWVDPVMQPFVLRLSDAEGYARKGAWTPGKPIAFPGIGDRYGGIGADLREIVDRAWDGERLNEASITRLFGSRGDEFAYVCATADEMRARIAGEAVSWVVTRNINYTNICAHRCTFCAFSKGRGRTSLRGPAYDLDREEIERRAAEAWARGATEVCMQGGIHPAYTGDTYLDIVRAVKSAAPEMHVHAFSPLEVAHGARSMGLSVAHYLERLQQAGLGSLPGTAAEILDERIRPQLCPDKLTTAEWIDVIETAHRVGLRTTSTIMFGHLDRPVHWASHLLALRDLQERTGGITEFVPLPFIHDEAPLYRQGLARRGPTAREAILMHAVARIVFGALIPNIQVSWVKLGPDGAARALRAGANDLGGTLMNESISAAAGAAHGQEMNPAGMQAIIASLGRPSRQRTTLYGDVTSERARAGTIADPLEPLRFGLQRESRSIDLREAFA
ncbi:5-amino-6-(D-ribitylamino)uracil--L-tyrosine 4-hydroxyphenyl transferase CofH [Sphingobium sp. DEHP117]|uniref:5-amino-6-(D-ribitylamino)uracil--L-tyrosine 4-hydroxyphenyl transferase CofH n=1 Tax=Sphingobium sp. DEHP117 TaxID=2993436 RepID=UPI0027D5FEC0|nr:5-amino-6-(D-ribitylamino)uracil--L-tyrosine 4-hydroxyphenyl transferase CofH [Sphingobium sp. DEHP117]